MELTQRIKQRLREADDWNAVLDELEGEAGATDDKNQQSAAFFELAQASEDMFLDKHGYPILYYKSNSLAEYLPALCAIEDPANPGVGGGFYDRSFHFLQFLLV